MQTIKVLEQKISNNKGIEKNEDILDENFANLIRIINLQYRNIEAT
jgi:hypothetical protein